LLALTGDVSGKFLRRRAAFNSEMLEKLFGNAHYNSKNIRHDLGFQPVYDFRKMLPEIVVRYKVEKKLNPHPNSLPL
jgi:hypothetical protein